MHHFMFRVQEVKIRWELWGGEARSRENWRGSESKGDRSKRKGRVGGTGRSQEERERRVRKRAGGITQETFVPRGAFRLSHLLPA